MEDDFVNNSVLILVKSSVIVNNKKIFKDIKKMGYQVAIIYDNNVLKEKDNQIYNVASYIFIDKKIYKTLNFEHLNPDVLVFEDIKSKLDIPGGE